MALVLGIDPSAKSIAVSAACLLPTVTHLKFFVLYKGKETQSPQSLGRALDAMAELIEWVDQIAPTGERFAWVEKPLVGRGGVVTTMKQAYVGGIIRGELSRAKFEVNDANVSTWKKQVVGNGRADKKQVGLAVQRLWPKAHMMAAGNEDLLDASAINLYGRELLRLRGPGAAGDTLLPRRSVRRPRS